MSKIFSLDSSGNKLELHTVFPDFFRKILKSGENRRIKGDKCTADYIDSYRFSFIVILCRFLCESVFL